MFTDRYGNLTDDADRDCTGTMQEFGPNEGYDPMYDDGHRSEFKCGRGQFGDPCCLDDDGKFVGPGCRHCCPPDHEDKPEGYGIETFDAPEWDAARAHFRNVWCFVVGLPNAHPRDWQHLLRKWAVKDGWSERLQRCSDRVWDRLCETCETHHEACDKYERWANKIKRKGTEPKALPAHEPAPAEGT